MQEEGEGNSSVRVQALDRVVGLFGQKLEEGGSSSYIRPVQVAHVYDQCGVMPGV